MSNYAIFFDYDNKTYRLPTNPEQIETSSTQAIEKYEVLKLGQIAIPTHMELKTYNFECEFPAKVLSYVETSGDFKNADYYIDLFGKWRSDLKPIRFIASNGIGEDINSLVLIEEMTITEKAGEEGDKYISFKLLEYKKYGKRVAIQTKTSTATVKLAAAPVTPAVIPAAPNTYVVKSGDSLWEIAKKFYGNGSSYIKIYDANKDKIKNANLIYPGQKLVIPA